MSLFVTKMQTIKAITALCLVVFAFTGCTGSSKPYELFRITDRAVENFYSAPDNYANLTDVWYTSNGVYKVQQLGRLINVRIEKAVPEEHYELLLIELRNHYSDDERVNDVYLCDLGTIMIDCMSPVDYAGESASTDDSEDDDSYLSVPQDDDGTYLPKQEDEDIEYETTEDYY